jgi:hypothetical protein
MRYCAKETAAGQTTIPYGSPLGNLVTDVPLVSSSSSSASASRRAASTKISCAPAVASRTVRFNDGTITGRHSTPAMVMYVVGTADSTAVGSAEERPPTNVAHFLLVPMLPIPPGTQTRNRLVGGDGGARSNDSQGVTTTISRKYEINTGRNSCLVLISPYQSTKTKRLEQQDKYRFVEEEDDQDGGRCLIGWQQCSITVQSWLVYSHDWMCIHVSAPPASNQ